MLFEPNTDDLRAVVSVSARLRDLSEMPVHIELTIVETSSVDSDWLYMEGNVPAVAPGEVRLESIYWRNAWQWYWSHDHTLRLYLTALTLTASDDTHVALDWLEIDEQWDLVHDSGLPIVATSQIVPTPDAPSALRDTSSYQITWDQDGNCSVIGIVLNYPDPDPIPAIASEELVAINGLLPGTRFQVGAIEHVRPWFEFVATTSYFPTLYSENRPFAVVDQQVLLYTLNRRPSANVHLSEVWLRLDAHASSEAIVNAVKTQTDQTILLKVETADKVFDNLGANILLAGLIGLLYLAFGVALTLAIISQIIYSVLSSLQRRTQYGILRALGFSVNHLMVTIALEHLIVIATGTALGAALGATISSLMIPTLAFGATGGLITPPFMIQFERAALAQYGLLILIMVAVTSTASVSLLRRLTLGDLLRFGEE